MTTFFYQATDRSGKYIEGDVEASDVPTAILKVRKLNYLPIKVTAEKPAPSYMKRLRVPEWFDRVKRKELMAFTQQLATMIGSGLTLDRSLAITVKLTERDKTRDTFGDVQKRVHAGSSFADALALHPKAFSKLYVSMIRAGELGGVLETVLQRLAAFLEKIEDTKSKLKSALTYPAILLIAGLGALIFLATFALPRILEIFEGMEHKLPWITRVLVFSVNLLLDYWMVFLGLTIAAVTAFVYYLRSDRGRTHWDGLLLKMPVIGDLIRKVEVSRFSRTMSTLLNSGIPVLSSLQITQNIITNRVIAQAMRKLHEGLKGGRGFAQPLKNLEIFPPLAIHMIVVGEETGAMEEMLVKVADTFDREVDNALKQALSLMQPIIVVILGIAILFMVLGILLGMSSVSDIAF